MVSVIDVGIKFIPLRTPGGELIPGSGLFVQIKKIIISVPQTSDRGVQEITPDQQIGSEEIAVVDSEDKSYCADELTEVSCDLETANCCERMPTRVSVPASLMYTNSHFKGSVQLNVIAEVNDDAQELSTTNDSYAAA